MQKGNISRVWMQMIGVIQIDLLQQYEFMQKYPDIGVSGGAIDVLQ